MSWFFGFVVAVVLVTVVGHFIWLVTASLINSVLVTNPARTARAESASNVAAGSVSVHHQIRYDTRKTKYVPLPWPLENQRLVTVFLRV